MMSRIAFCLGVLMAFSVNAQVIEKYPLDSTIIYGEAANSQSDPVIAFDGTNYLLVWEDNRDNSSSIMGARVTPQGVILDSAGIRISSDGIGPAVAFDGVNYMVAWGDYRNGDYDIYGARLSPAGELLDTNGFPIYGTDGDDQWDPDIAYNGENFLVVWVDGYIFAEFTLGAARVGTDGTVLDTGDIYIHDGDHSENHVAVSSTGDDWLVVWTDGRNLDDDVYGARIDQSGQVLDSAGFAIASLSGRQWEPDVASDSTNYMVVWYDGSSGSVIWGARVDTAGAVLDNPVFCISDTSNYKFEPKIAFNGTHYLVTWNDRRLSGGNIDIYGIRVTTDGTVLGEDFLPLCTAEENQAFIESLGKILS